MTRMSKVGGDGGGGIVGDGGGSWGSPIGVPGFGGGGEGEGGGGEGSGGDGEIASAWSGQTEEPVTAGSRAPSKPTG